MSSKAKKFEGKNDVDKKKNIIEFLERVSTKLGIKRDELAPTLGISNSAFYGWIYRREIPGKAYEKLLLMLDGTYKGESKGSSTSSVNTSSPYNLSKVSLDDLIAEVERRNWIVKIERKP